MKFTGNRHIKLSFRLEKSFKMAAMVACLMGQVLIAARLTSTNIARAALTILAFEQSRLGCHICRRSPQVTVTTGSLISWSIDLLLAILSTWWYLEHVWLTRFSLKAPVTAFKKGIIEWLGDHVELTAVHLAVSPGLVDGEQALRMSEPGSNSYWTYWHTQFVKHLM